MIGPDASSVRVRGELELEVGDEQDLLEQLVEVRRPASRRPARPASSRPTPRAGGPGSARSASTRSGFAPGEVDLVDGDDDRHLGGAGVRDRLERLRHDAVVGGDDEDRDVGDLRAAGAHGGERLVARRVEEGDLPAVDVGLVGADVLRDPAGLGLDDGRLADRVEQRRLAVVDVAHDRDDRRPRLQRLVGVVERLRARPRRRPRA